LQNTTPDDVPICEAYLAFLRSNGDHGAYWNVLSGAHRPGPPFGPAAATRPQRSQRGLAD
jgi:hypothetical protein